MSLRDLDRRPVLQRGETVTPFGDLLTARDCARIHDDCRNRVPLVAVVGPDVRVREVIRLIEQQGWRLVRQRGSHRQCKHPFRPGVVTIAGRDGSDLPIGTLRSIFRQAGIRR